MLSSEDQSLTLLTANLVWILHDEILSWWLLKAGVNDGMKHSPCIPNVQGHLLSQFSWFDLLNSKDFMTFVLCGVLPRYISAMHGDVQ